MRRPSRHALLWWGFGKTVLAGVTRLLVPMRDYGRERIPREGGVVLAVNHLAWVDVPPSAPLCPRRIVYLAKAEAFRDPGARLADGRDGHALRPPRGVRPRGDPPRPRGRAEQPPARRSSSRAPPAGGEPGEAKTGAAMIAMQEGVPVLPAAVTASVVAHLAGAGDGRVGRADALRAPAAQRPGLQAGDRRDRGRDPPPLGRGSARWSGSAIPTGRRPPRRAAFPGRMTPPLLGTAAVVGFPNVGKSTLVNRPLGHARKRSSSRPPA